MGHTDLSEVNRRIVADMYAAAQARDLEAFFAVISPEVIVREPPFLPYGGIYRGITELQQLFREVTKLLDLSSLTVERVIADEERALGVITVRTVEDGETVRLIETSLLRDGLVVEMEIFFHDAASLPLTASP